MNQHPITLVEPVFKWLDWLIAEHGLYLLRADEEFGAIIKGKRKDITIKSRSTDQQSAVQCRSS